MTSKKTKLTRAKVEALCYGGSPSTYWDTELRGFGVNINASCVSAWNKDPVFGVIGIQSGPRH